MLYIIFRLHDRKLCVLGICTLLEMGPQRPNLDEVLPKILPSCLVLFDGLKRAYEARAEADDDTSSEEDDGDDDEGTNLLSFNMPRGYTRVNLRKPSLVNGLSNTKEIFQFELAF